jgi:hypothetical protein
LNIIGTILLFSFLFFVSFFISKKLERTVLKQIVVSKNDIFVNGFSKTVSVLNGSKIEFLVNVESSLSVSDGFGCSFNGVAVKK